MNTRYIILATSFLLAACTPVLDNEEKPDNNQPEPPSVGQNEESKRCVPVIIEEFRELYHPSAAVGIYMNDHTVFPKADAKGTDPDRWHVIGITNMNWMEVQEKYIFPTA